MSPTAWQRIVTASSSAATVFTAGSEIVAVTVQVNDVSPDAPVHLFGFAFYSTAAGATVSTPRIRRGGVAGTLVGTAPAVTTPASSVIQLTQAADDNPGEVATQTYSLTVQQVGGAGTGIQAYIMAVVG